MDKRQQIMDQIRVIMEKEQKGMGAVSGILPCFKAHTVFHGGDAALSSLPLRF